MDNAKACDEEARSRSEALTQRISALSADEQRVVAKVVDGLELGRSVYGPLVLKTDGRHFGHEAALELRDYLVYAAAVAVAEDDARGRGALVCSACGGVR